MLRVSASRTIATPGPSKKEALKESAHDTDQTGDNIYKYDPAVAGMKDFRRTSQELTGHNESIEEIALWVLQGFRLQGRVQASLPRSK